MTARAVAPFLTVAVVLLGAGAQAQATRTWVSGVGDDVNPCSRTAPCKTFAGALSKTAAGGEIDVLDPADFGPVTISKAITLNGSYANDGDVAGMTVSATDGVVITAGINDAVVLKGLSIEGLTTALSGVHFTSGKALHVQECHIKGFATGIDFSPDNGGTLVVQDTQVENNSGAGIRVQSAAAVASATLIRVKAHRNGVGVLTGHGGKATVTRSALNQNSTAGLLAASDGGTAETNVEDAVFASNGFGVQAIGTQTIVRLSKASINGSDVHATLLATGGRVLSFGNNRVVGQPPSEIALTGPNTTTAGSAATYNVAVTSDGGIPDGRVQLNEGGTTLASTTLDPQGNAALSPTLTEGSHSVTAAYVGTINFAPSTSSALSVTTSPGSSSPTYGKKGCGCNTTPPEFSMGLLSVLAGLMRRRFKSSRG